MQNSCKDCIYYNNGLGQVMCEWCDAGFNDCFEHNSKEVKDVIKDTDRNNHNSSI